MFIHQIHSSISWTLSWSLSLHVKYRCLSLTSSTSVLIRTIIYCMCAELYFLPSTNVFISQQATSNLQQTEDYPKTMKTGHVWFSSPPSLSSCLFDVYWTCPPLSQIERYDMTHKPQKKTLPTFLFLLLCFWLCVSCQLCVCICKCVCLYIHI